MSVRAIGEAAGVSHALVHRYVGSKADILRAVLARHEGVLAGAAADATTVREAAARHARRRHAGHAALLPPGAAREHGQRAARASPASASRRRGCSTAVAVAAVRGGRRRERPASTPRLGVAAVVSLVVGFAGLRDDLLQRGRAERSVADGDLDAQMARIVDALLAATVPEPPGGELTAPCGEGVIRVTCGYHAPADGPPGFRRGPTAHNVREDRDTRSSRRVV